MLIYPIKKELRCEHMERVRNRLEIEKIWRLKVSEREREGFRKIICMGY